MIILPFWIHLTLFKNMHNINREGNNFAFMEELIPMFNPLLAGMHAVDSLSLWLHRRGLTGQYAITDYIHEFLIILTNGD